jgi:hypothetical protein
LVAITVQLYKVPLVKLDTVIDRLVLLVALPVAGVALGVEAGTQEAM